MNNKIHFNTKVQRKNKRDINVHLYITDKILGGDVGLAISQALIVIGMLQYGIKQTVEVIIQMTSVERIFQYMNLPKEKSLIIANSLPPTWPSQGQLVLKNVSMRYSPNEPYVLKVNFICKCISIENIHQVIFRFP